MTRTSCLLHLQVALDGIPVGDSILSVGHGWEAEPNHNGVNHDFTF